MNRLICVFLLWIFALISLSPVFGQVQTTIPNAVLPLISPIPAAIETSAAPTTPSPPVATVAPQTHPSTSVPIPTPTPPIFSSLAATNASPTNATPLDLTNLAAAAQAGDLVAESKLSNAYAKGEGVAQDYNQVFTWTSEAAFQGDIQGESALGWLYSNGKGVHRNESKAFAWYLKAAKQGDATAERCVGSRYQSGMGVPHDDGLAAPWLHKAAIQGESIAKDLYGISLLNGLGVGKDYKKGFTYVLSSACDFYVPAYLVVAQCYSRGAFVPRDLVQAYRWCLMADQKDSQVLALEEGLKKQLSDDQIKEAERANEDWAKMMKGDRQPDTLVTAFANGNSVTLPFKKAVGHIYVPVKVNNQEVNIMIDTGVDFSGIDERLADKLQLSGKDYLPVNGTGAELALGTIAENVNLDLGGLSFIGARVLVMPNFDLDQYMGLHIGGIIGSDLMRRFVVQIDYIKQTITFSDPKTFKADTEAVALPIQFSHSIPFIDVALSNAQANGVKGTFEIDTGDSSSINITKSFFDANPALQLQGVVNGGGAGLGGVSYTRDGKVVGMSFGNLTVKDAVVSLSQAREGAFLNSAGRIGNKLLSHFEITLDYPNAKVYLKPSSHFAEPFDYHYLGFGINATGTEYDTFNIWNILPQSPGSVAGLKVGDLLREIDKKPTAGTSLDDVYQAFDKDGLHEMDIQRGNSTLSLGVNVFDPFKNPEKIPELTATAADQSVPSAPVIKGFDVSYIGPPLYNKEVIVKASGLKIGDPCLRFDLTRALKNLYSTGMIENMAITAKTRPNGVTVSLVVQAAPIVTKVAFAGLTSDQETKVRPMLLAEEGKRITKYDVHQDEQTIQAELAKNGRVSAIVTSKLDENSTSGEAQVTYTIQ